MEPTESPVLFPGPAKPPPQRLVAPIVLLALITPPRQRLSPADPTNIYTSWQNM